MILARRMRRFFDRLRRTMVCRRLAVEVLAELHRDLGQRFRLRLDRVDILAGQGRLQVLDRGLDGLAARSAAACRQAPSSTSRSGTASYRHGCAPPPARACACRRRHCFPPRAACAGCRHPDRPPEAWMRTCCSLPVALSLAPTCTRPLASMSKVTSICGRPRGAGGRPIRSNCASSLVVGGHVALALEHADGHGRLVILGRSRRSDFSWSESSCCGRSGA